MSRPPAYTRFSREVCFVCARPAIGHAVAPHGNDRLGWICDDLTCIQIGRDTYSMGQDQFRRVDAEAVDLGGEVGGAYLDHIGKTDLAELTEDEWRKFLQHIVGGYRVALQTTLKDEGPF